MLFHTGTRRLFPAVRDAVATVVDPAAIRWISSGNASRPDEYGALSDWEAVALSATVAHGRAGCFLCLSDMASRPPRALADYEVIDNGGHLLQWIDTPHVPGPWEAGVLYDQNNEDAVLRRPVLPHGPRARPPPPTASPTQPSPTTS